MFEYKKVLHFFYFFLFTLSLFTSYSSIIHYARTMFPSHYYAISLPYIVFHLLPSILFPLLSSSESYNWCCDRTFYLGKICDQTLVLIHIRYSLKLFPLLSTTMKNLFYYLYQTCNTEKDDRYCFYNEETFEFRTFRTFDTSMLVKGKGIETGLIFGMKCSNFNDLTPCCCFVYWMRFIIKNIIFIRIWNKNFYFNSVISVVISVNSNYDNYYSSIPSFYIHQVYIFISSLLHSVQYRRK